MLKPMIAAAALGLLTAACAEAPVDSKASAAPAAAVATPAPADAAGMGLKIEDKKIGTGAEAVNGSTVSVHYAGRLLQSQKQFDSSYARGPFTFKLGAGQVIKGWDMGVLGMKVGGKRVLTIPASLGYGASGAGGVIPPNADLEFDVELLEVK